MTTSLNKERLKSVDGISGDEFREDLVLIVS